MYCVKKERAVALTVFALYQDGVVAFDSHVMFFNCERGCDIH